MRAWLVASLALAAAGSADAAEESPNGWRLETSDLGALLAILEHADGRSALVLGCHRAGDGEVSAALYGVLGSSGVREVRLKFDDQPEVVETWGGSSRMIVQGEPRAALAIMEKVAASRKVVVRVAAPRGAWVTRAFPLASDARDPIARVMAYCGL